MSRQPGGMGAIRSLVKRRDYDWSVKVNQLIKDGWFSQDDLEQCVLTGYVRKTERDEMKDCVGNKKYTIIGKDSHGYPFYTVGKIKRSEEGKLRYLFITAHQYGR